MNGYQRKVEEFHEVVRGENLAARRNEPPQVRDAELRAKLVIEEAFEFCDALGFRVETDYGGVHAYGAPALVPTGKPPDLALALDAICDLAYVALGAASVFGVDLDPFFDEVHRSNLAKAGGGRREDGKSVKPANWRAPRIAEMLAALKRRRASAECDCAACLRREVEKVAPVEVPGGAK